MSGPAPSFTLPDVRHPLRSAGVLVAAAMFAACSTPAVPSLPPATSPAATATQAVATGCPGAAPAVLPDLTGEMVPADAVSAYLEAGGDPTTLAATLFDRGWLSPASTVVWTDVDGDGNLDFAAGLTGAPGSQGVAGAGGVYLWRCLAGTVLRTEIAPPRPDFGLPTLREARDLTADGIPEVIVAYPLCGAHTCFAHYAVFQWNGASMVDRFQGAGDDMPSPELVVLADDPQAPAALEITATGIGSVGAGPYRVWRRTWTWDAAGLAFVPGEALFEAPRFRIHAVHDADDAYLRGDMAAALELYQRVLDDDGLIDWPSAGDRRQELSAYAAFRRVLAFLVSGDAQSAQAELDDRLMAPGASTAAYAELARRLLAESKGSSLVEACAAVASFARENADAVLAPLDFGYANRTYTAEDICPIIGS